MPKNILRLKFDIAFLVLFNFLFWKTVALELLGFGVRLFLRQNKKKCIIQGSLFTVNLACSRSVLLLSEKRKCRAQDK
jgi:hypothetical protein